MVRSLFSSCCPVLIRDVSYKGLHSQKVINHPCSKPKLRSWYQCPHHIGIEVRRPKRSLSGLLSCRMWMTRQTTKRTRRSRSCSMPIHVDRGFTFSLPPLWDMCGFKVPLRCGILILYPVMFTVNFVLRQNVLVVGILASEGSLTVTYSSRCSLSLQAMSFALLVLSHGIEIEIVWCMRSPSIGGGALSSIIVPLTRRRLELHHDRYMSNHREKRW